MDQDNAIARFFAIPELIHLLGQSLPIRELAQLVRTNRANFETFTPFLWRSIPQQKACAMSLSPSLSKRVHLIQCVDLSYNDLNTMSALNIAMEFSKELRSCRQAAQYGTKIDHTGSGLRSLHFVVDKSDSTPSRLPPIAWSKNIYEQLIMLLQQTSFLTCLSVPADILEYEPRHLNAFMNALTFSLPGLQRLTISRKRKIFISLQSSLVVVGRCLELMNLDTLLCEFEPNQNETYPIGSEVWRTLFAQCLDQLQGRLPHQRSNKLRKLRLPCTIWPLDFLVPFFKDCVHDLETLFVPYFDVPVDWVQQTGNDLREAIQSSCPNIKSVTVCRYTQPYQRDGYITLAVKTILESCASKGDAGDAVVETGLQSFDATDSVLDWTQIESALEPHFQTLRVLSSKVGGQHLAGLGLLVQRSEKLRILNMNWSYKTPGGYPLDKWPSEWVCRGLRVLCVQMKDPAYGIDPTASEEAKQQNWEQVNRFYLAIGQLEALEDLTLGYGASSFTSFMRLPDLLLTFQNTEGCLWYLTRWKKLRRLRLMNDFWSRMGEAEIDFISEHWPQLVDLTFRTDDIDWMRKFLNTMHCWRMLKRQLPNLAFSFIKSSTVPHPQ
ncbi:hypothetical protein EMPS_07308 [Entomortierella parvispora]|uniref:Uncharacterized protein n=1 Tax=Entomortierella parvispora TaxID=205924 RepID=A0A9P3LYK2_9FUNG|nr:hypothetical protein EMPS_07308 [Entomortierella parvispora]